jgi:hypothetical protein
MEFLSIEINQISPTYIEFVQYKTIIPEIIENPDGSAQEIGKEITYLQNKMIFPIAKMNIQTICEPIEQKRFGIPKDQMESPFEQPKETFANESFFDVEYIAIILSMSNLNSFALPKYTENEMIKGDDVRYIKTPNQFMWIGGEKIEFDQFLINLTHLGSKLVDQPIKATA